MIDDLRAMVIFAKTVQLGSFRATANAFELSPSVVSYHISQLEQRFGVTLLYRSTRKLSLTNEGKRLYEHAKTMIDAAEEGLDVLAGEAASPTGKLNITVPAVLTRSALTKKIATFSKSLPNVELNITFTDERQDLIAEGIDVAIRIGQLDNSNLKSKKLFKVHRKLVCSQTYFSSKNKPSSPEDLNDWNWIGLGMLPASRTLKNQQGETFNTANKSSVMVNSVDATCQLAIHGLGLASPPDFMVEKEIDQGLLVHVLPGWEIADIDVYAVWPANQRRESLALKFINAIEINGT
jgi:DNA-binding transcriptional LysR family regulator